MNVNADEVALREMFQDLTADQPPAPSWRYQQVLRRLSRRRWWLAARWSTAIALAGATAAAGALVPALSGGGNHTPRTVPAWALPWPDHRDGSVPQKVLDGAVTAWRHQQGVDAGTPLPRVRRVIWYVGQTAAAGQDVIVAFEADTPAGRYLVAGTSTASEVMNGQPGWSDSSSPWVLWAVPAPARRAGLAIGLNMPGPPPSDGFPDNWIMVLAAPSVRAVAWTTPTGSGTRPARAVTKDGLMIADVGQVTGRVQLTALIADHRNVLSSPRYVGVPGSVVTPGEQSSDVPQMEEAAPLSPPSAYRSVRGGSGQGSTVYLERDQVIRRRPALFARCYGPKPLRIYLDNRLAGVIICDNAQHELLLARPARRHTVNLEIDTSDLTAWRFDMGSVP
jgi:hypothetical protein